MLNTVTVYGLILLCSVVNQTCVIQHEETGTVLYTHTFEDLQVKMPQSPHISWLDWAIGASPNTCCTCSATEGCCPAGCANLPGMAQLGCCLGCGTAGCNVMACMGC